MNTYNLFNEFFTGINYWSSENSINMWSDFNAKSVERDFKLLKDAGITHLRIFPVWPVFQPLHAIYGPGDVYEYTFSDEKPLPNTPAGKAGVSEDACKIFECFCSLAEKYDLKLIVALITGHMSFRTYVPPAFEGKELLSDPTIIKWQRKFVIYFVTRFKNSKSIVAWDLGNEPDNLPGAKCSDAFYLWCSIISDSIRMCDNSRPVISGLAESSVERGKSNLRTIADTCDINTTHPYNIFQTSSEPLTTIKPVLDLAIRCKFSEDIGNIPTFVQEFGSTGYMNCSYKTEADFYRGCLFTALAHGCHGTMWWCAFDQGHLDYPPYRWNNIGSNYGFFDNNLNEKPIVSENKTFKKLLSTLPGGKLPPHTTCGTVIVPRDDGNMNMDILKNAYILSKQANTDINFSYALDPVPYSPLYIMPCYNGNHSITKQCLDQILDNVKKGSVLYISADTGFLRQIPEITGVNISYREQIDEIKKIRLNGEVLPIKTQFFYKTEKSNAETIATDENGEGVFFRYKYGNGFVYFLTLPLESFLSNKRGVFFKEKQPNYSIIYKELIKAAGIKRFCDSDNKFIRLTEHIIDENSLYVVAINYNNKVETAEISVKDCYLTESVWGTIDNNVITLRENDGVIFKLKRCCD